MKIPRAAAVQRLLAGLYHDTADIARSRVDLARSGMTVETLQTGVRCHLSMRKGLGAHRTASLKQNEAYAQVSTGFTVFFAPDTPVLPGDLLTVTHGAQTVRGRAGYPTFGAFGMAVPLDFVTVA